MKDSAARANRKLLKLGSVLGDLNKQAGRRQVRGKSARKWHDLIN